MHGHAARRFRPFCRRRLMTARPARVCIRARNPCLRLRRRFFGWYVRFISPVLTAEDYECRPAMSKVFGPCPLTPIPTPHGRGVQGMAASGHIAAYKSRTANVFSAPRNVALHESANCANSHRQSSLVVRASLARAL